MTQWLHIMKSLIYERIAFTIVHCPLSVVRCPLSVVRCPLSVVHPTILCSSLSIVHCPLSIVLRPLLALRLGSERLGSDLSDL